MPDISDEVDSNSSKVTVTKDHVQRLIKHLAEVGIPNTETMIAIGGQAYRILEANKDLIHGALNIFLIIVRKIGTTERWTLGY